MRARFKKLILAVMLAISLPSFAHDFEVDGIYYNILSESDKTVEVTYKGSYRGSYSGKVTIPETVTYSGTNYSVTSIGYEAFEDCSYLTEVTIPKSVTSIGSEAFYSCSGLTEVTIPNSVTSIDNFGFRGCSGLTEVTIPNSVTSIGQSAFAYCSGLTEVTIGKSVTSIGYEAFKGCSGLTEVNYNAENCTSMGNHGSHVFKDCTNLKTVNIGNSVNSIPNYAFDGCYGLTKVTIPNSVTSIGEYAFYNCDGLTKVTIPNSVTSIGNSAFYGCSGLTSVIIGNSVTKIGQYAFYWCSGLTSVTIGNSVTSIGYEAFYRCTKLFQVINHSKLALTKGSTDYGYVAYNAHEVINDGIIDGDFVWQISENENKLIAYLGNAHVVNFPSDFNGKNYIIGNYAFSGHNNIVEVTIPNSVTEIGDEAFYGCSGLTSLTIGTGVLSIGTNAFSYYENNKYSNLDIKKVIWLTNTPPEGYKNVGSKAHYVSNNLYTGLSNVTIYPYLSSLFEVDGIKYVPVSPSERTCDAIDCVYDSSAANINIGNTVSFRGVEMTLQDIKPYICYNNDYISDCKINFTGNVGRSAFYDCDAIKNIEINATTIGGSAFYDCDAINNIEINATTIGGFAFSDCDAITKVEINATAINSYAFSNSATLEAAKFIIEAETIGNNAFNGCSAIYNADIKATTISDYAFSGSATIYPAKFIIEAETIGTAAFNGCNKVETITLSENLTSIGTSAFQNCSSLKGVVIPDDVTLLGSSAFSGCSSLASVEIGSGISALNDNTFSGCTSLPAITIPANVTSIGNYVFGNCTSLANVTIEDSEIIEEEFQKQQSFPNWTSSNHDNNSTSSEEYNINVNPGDVLTFNYTVSSESNYDFLIVKLDGKEILKESGSKSGNYNTTFDSTKVVALYMEYTKDSSNSDGTDNAAVTDIIINGSSAEGSLILGSNGSSPLFSDCPLNTVYIGRDISYSTSSGNGYSPFYSNKSLKNVILKNETNLTDYEFAGCTGLESIDFGNSINQFGSYVFYNCSSLEELIIPNTVAEIGISTFEGCSSLALVKIGSGISALNDNTFYGCTSLPAITIPANITSIGNNVFGNCSSLAEVTIEESEIIEEESREQQSFPNWTSSNHGNNSTSSEKYNFNVNPGDVLTFNYTVSSESNYDFLIVKLDGKEILKESGSKSGNYTTKFDSTKVVVLYMAYTKNYSNSNGTDNASVTDIMINGSSVEDSLVLGSNGSNPLFSDCPLKSVYIGCNISYPTSSDYGYSPFYRNTSLEMVVITDKETEISENEFYGCTALKTVSMGDGVKTIGNWAFSGCSSLDSFSFGSGMKTIGTEAFSDCTAMTKLYSKAVVPPTCGSQALDDINKWNCELYVPQSSIADYQVADQWKEFFFINGIVSTINDIAIEDSAVTAEDGKIVVKNVTGIVTVYNLNGIAVATETADGNEVRFDNLQPGVYIVVVNNKSVKVVL